MGKQVRDRRWKLVLLVLGLVAGSVLAEMALRLAGVSYPTLYTYDPELASTHLPGARGWWLTEGRGYVSINGAGMRDREHVIDKPDGAFRIALLGDSYAEAFQVNAEETFWSLAAETLNDKGMKTGAGGKSVEILNFGVATYSTTQELLQLRRDVWRYQPDLVLLAFTPQNDVWENVKPLARRLHDDRAEVKPFFELRDDGLVLDSSFRDTAPYRARSSRYECLKASLVNASYVLQVLKHVKQNGFARTGPQEHQPGEMVLEDARRLAGTYVAPQEPEWELAWQLTERLILELRDDVRDQGAEFGIVVLSTCLQAYPDRQIRQRFLSEQKIDDLFYTNDRIVALARREAIRVLDVGRAVQDCADRSQVRLHGFSNTPDGLGHYNAAGHRLVAGQLAAWLQEQIR